MEEQRHDNMESTAGRFCNYAVEWFASKGWMKFWLRKLIKENTIHFIAQLKTKNFTVMKRGFSITKHENTSWYINSHMQ
jgi:hypothetical protein